LIKVYDEDHNDINNMATPAMTAKTANYFC